MRWRWLNRLKSNRVVGRAADTVAVRPQPDLCDLYWAARKQSLILD